MSKLVWHRKHAGYYYASAQTTLNGQPVTVELEATSQPWNESESMHDVWWGFSATIKGAGSDVQLCKPDDTWVNTFRDVKTAVERAVEVGWRFNGDYYFLGGGQSHEEAR